MCRSRGISRNKLLSRSHRDTESEYPGPDIRHFMPGCLLRASVRSVRDPLPDMSAHCARHKHRISRGERQERQAEMKWTESVSVIDICTWRSPCAWREIPALKTERSAPRAQLQ